MFVYMMASQKYGTIYTGVTSDLVRRIYEHKQGIADSFTKKYNVKELVYYEAFDDPENAIRREKQIKNWKRQWRINVINDCNSHWKNLHNSMANQ